MERRNVIIIQPRNVSIGHCLACRHGNSSTARMSVGPFNDMLENYKKTRHYKSVDELAFDLEEQFEKQIR